MLSGFPDGRTRPQCSRQAFKRASWTASRVTWPLRPGAPRRARPCAPQAAAGQHAWDSAVLAFRDKLITQAAGAPAAGAAAGLDFSHWFGDASISDVKLRVVVRDGGGGGGSGGGGDRSGKRPATGRAKGAAAAATANEAPAAASRPATRSATAAAAAAAAEDGGGSGGDGGGSEAGCAPAPGKRVIVEFPGHAMLLSTASAWAQAQLADATARELEVEVADESEVAAAELLLQCIYSTADPGRPLRGADPDTLLAVLRLAARLEVPACLRAAGGALISATSSSRSSSSGGGGALPWEAVLAAFELPAHTPELREAARPLRAAAEEALQAELGDLDLAWMDARCRERLMALPLAAITCLLSDGRTRVLSEASVFYTADAWLAARKPRGGAREQQAALAACVRAPALRLSYLCGVAAASPWYTLHVPPGALHEAIAYSIAAERIAALATSAVEVPVPRLASWGLPPRPASRASKLSMEWDVPLAALRRLAREAVAEGDGGSAELAAPHTWVLGGMRWALELQAEYDEDDGVSWGLFVTPAPPPLHPADGGPGAALVTARISLDARCTRRKLRAGGVMQLLLGREGRGFNDMFEMGPQPAAWDEGPWRAAGLVGDDGCVRVTATVRDVC